ncbi:hypothetical protein L7F22_030627 [Adiantum nelumboides]|nr:hypothetical protein [Adiantum nelumboides]
MVAAQRAKTSVDTSAEISVHTSPRQRNSPLKRGEGDIKIRKRSRAFVAIDIESDSDSKMHKREKLAMTTRWRAPKVRCPLQTIFCQTKKDFNNHYGLDIEGKDPRLLKDSDVSEGDWLSVFSHSRDTSSYKVKCSSIRPEQYEDLLIFYMKVYQKRPTNMEVNVSFARAYVLQFIPRAVKAGRTVNVKEPNIELTSPPPIAPLVSHSLSMQLTDDRTKEGKLRALIEDVQCRLIVAKDEHATCLKKLEAGKVQQLSDEKFGNALSLLDEQINATKLKLASIAEDDPITRIQLASQLEAQESMQAVLGVGSSEPANVSMLTVEFLADVVKEKEMQHNLLQEMLHRVEVGRQAYICPPPPFVMSLTLDNFTLPAKYAGCGTSFKTSLGYTPFHLVYGQDALLPIEVELASLQVIKAHQEYSQEKQVEKRIIDLERLGLDQESAVKYYVAQAEKKQKKFNRNLVKQGIKESSLVLRYDNRFDRRKDGKFLLKWEGPFVVIQRFSNGSYQLGDLNGKVHQTAINGWRLKAYHCRLSQPYADGINAKNGSEESSSYLSSN